MMHTLRLLLIAEEIVKDGVINVFRTDREYILSIKSGNYEYVELLNNAEKKNKQLEQLYSLSTLPPSPDIAYLEDILINTRKAFYSSIMNNTKRL